MNKNKFVSILLSCTVLAGSLCGCGFNKDPEIKTSESETQPVPESTIEKLFSTNGFEEEHRRVEVEFDDSKGLNTKRMKKYIFDRMLNSVDYFDAVQGTYFYVQSQGNPYYVTYQVQQGEKPYSKELVYNIDGEMTGFFCYDGTAQIGAGGDGMPVPGEADSKMDEKICRKIISERKKITIEDFSADMIYDNTPVDIQEKKSVDYVSLVDSFCRGKVDEKTGEISRFYRENLPLLTTSNIQYFPQNFAFNFLGYFGKWDIDGIEKFFGRDCFVISGKISGTYAGQMNTKKFEMVVDKETGAVISLKGYDHYKNQTLQLTTFEFSAS